MSDMVKCETVKVTITTELGEVIGPYVIPAYTEGLSRFVTRVHTHCCERT